MDRRRFLSTSAMAGIAAAVEPFEPRGGREAALEPDGSEGPVVFDGLNVSNLNEAYLADLRAGGVHGIHKSVGLSLPALGALLAFIDGRDDVIRATTVAEIRAAKQSGKLAVVLGMQHSNEIEAVLRKSVTDSLTSIDAAVRTGYEAGVRVQGIAYNLLNVFGAGCLDPSVGLSRAGRRLVESIHRTGIVLDVGGHTGEQTSLDAVAMSSGVPIICSHTNVAALNPNMRAMSDRLIEAIAGTGGVVGLTAISDFIVRNPDSARRHGPRSPQARLDDLLDQYDHVRRLVGAEHVGLGTDFTTGFESAYIFGDLSENLAFPPESLSKGALQFTGGFENISKLPNLRRGLEERGWRANEVTMVLGENWLRVYRRVWDP